MSKTNIEWSDEVWNPLAGCTRASEGCDHCYAAQMSLRLEAMANADIAVGKDPGRKAKYIGVATKNKQGIAAFNGKINLDYDVLMEPLNWRKPRRVFVNSMSDLFHKDVPFEFVFQVFSIMDATPDHTYQVLTKRPDRMLKFQQEYYRFGFPANVWAMTSVENQETADGRIPFLKLLIARVIGLSMEPLLGPVDLRIHLECPTCRQGRAAIDGVGWVDNELFCYCHDSSLNWVIVGGESGPHARPMHPEWARSLRDQCAAAGVPFFFKQWGNWKPGMWRYLYNPITEFACRDKEGVFPDGQIMWNVGKKDAGRLLDGRTHDEFPQ